MRTTMTPGPCRAAARCSVALAVLLGATLAAPQEPPPSGAPPAYPRRAAQAAAAVRQFRSAGARPATPPMRRCPQFRPDAVRSSARGRKRAAGRHHPGRRAGTDPPAKAKAKAKEGEVELEDIRSPPANAQSERDLPGSVGAVRGEDLEKMHAQGLGTTSSSFRVTYIDDGTERIGHRGISSAAGLPATAATTGIFLDDMPFGDLFVPLSLRTDPFRPRPHRGAEGPQDLVQRQRAGRRHPLHRAQAGSCGLGAKGSGRDQSKYGGGLAPVTASVNASAVRRRARHPRGRRVAPRAGLYDEAAFDSNGNTLRNAPNADKLRQNSARAGELEHADRRAQGLGVLRCAEDSRGRSRLADRLRHSGGSYPSIAARQRIGPALGGWRSRARATTICRRQRRHVRLRLGGDLQPTRCASTTGSIRTRVRVRPRHAEPDVILQHAVEQAQRLHRGVAALVTRPATSAYWEWVAGAAFMIPRPHCGSSATSARSSPRIRPIPAGCRSRRAGTTSSGPITTRSPTRGGVRRNHAPPRRAVGSTLGAVQENHLDSRSSRAARGLAARCRAPTTSGGAGAQGINPKASLRFLHNHNVRLYVLAAKGFQFGRQAADRRVPAGGAGRQATRWCHASRSSVELRIRHPRVARAPPALRHDVLLPRLEGPAAHHTVPISSGSSIALRRADQRRRARALRRHRDRARRAVHRRSGLRARRGLQRGHRRRYRRPERHDAAGQHAPAGTPRGSGPTWCRTSTPCRSSRRGSWARW